MNKKNGVKPAAIVWDEIIYQSPQEAMERLGFSALKEVESPLYIKLNECLVALMASKRFIKMDESLNNPQKTDSYFENTFLLNQLDELKQKKENMSKQEQMFFDYEMGISVLYGAHNEAKNTQNEKVLHTTEKGIQSIVAFYREKFHSSSFKFHDAMFKAETIEMDSVEARGLKQMDIAYEEDKKVWNSILSRTPLKEMEYGEELFWGLVWSYVPQEKAENLKKFFSNSPYISALEPVGITTHSNVNNISFWKDNLKTLVKA